MYCIQDFPTVPKSMGIKKVTKATPFLPRSDRKIAGKLLPIPSKSLLDLP